MPPGDAFRGLESSGYVERWYPYLGDDGKLYSFFNTPPNVKLIALVVSYECSSGHALAMALDDALPSQWSTVNGMQSQYDYHLTCGDSEGSTVPQVLCSYLWNQYPPEHPGYSGSWKPEWVGVGTPAISTINPGDYRGYFYVDYKYLDEWKDGMVNTTNLLHCTGGWSAFDGTTITLPDHHEHPAASSACNYNCGATIPGNVVKSNDCSNGWFLPSMWDWTCAVWGIDNQSKNGAPDWDTTFGTINRHLNKVGATPLKRGTGAEDSYWTSCETTMEKASCAYYTGLYENTKTGSLKVRPFLKFTNICGEWFYLVDPAQHQGFDGNGNPVVGGN